MTNQDFDKILEERIQKIRAILAYKADEYARGDRLSNFKKTAALMGCQPENACVYFWMKHVTSIVDLSNDLNDGKCATFGMWQEKIGDAINYLILLEGLVTERINKQ